MLYCDVTHESGSICRSSLYLCAAVHRGIGSLVPSRRARGVRISLLRKHFSSARTDKTIEWIPASLLQMRRLALSRFINLASDTQLRERLFIVRLNFMNETGRTIPHAGKPALSEHIRAHYYRLIHTELKRRLKQRLL